MARRSKRTVRPTGAFGGGDVLARGTKSPVAFPSLSHVDLRRFDYAFMTEEEFVAKHGPRAWQRAEKGKF